MVWSFVLAWSAREFERSSDSDIPVMTDSMMDVLAGILHRRALAKSAVRDSSCLVSGENVGSFAQYASKLPILSHPQPPR
ncbi:hypothetical protein EMIT0194P_110185 [Pseudomonas serbica]